MKLSIQGQGGNVDLADAAFAATYNEALVHQVVTAFLAKARSGTKAQKNRSSAQGGGAKPWRQKGTGRARAGSIRSPIWVGGGRAFAAKPRDFSQKVNRKMYRAAMRSVLSELVRQERLIVVDEFAVAEPKTKLLVGRLQELGVGQNALIVVEEYNDSLCLSARNLPMVDVLDLREVNPVSLIRFERIIATVGALKQLEEQLS